MNEQTQAVLSPLERDHGLKLLREMVRIRRFEEKCVELYSASVTDISRKASAYSITAAADDDIQKIE